MAVDAEGDYGDYGAGGSGHGRFGGLVIED